MSIGIVLLIKGFGGTYQYSLTMIDSLSILSKEKKTDKFIIFTPDLSHPTIEHYKNRGWQIESLYPKKFDLILKLLKSKFDSRPGNFDSIIYKKDQENWFKKFGIDLMIYPTTHPLSFETKIPYIISIHDLQHRLQPRFPEVSANGELKAREYQYHHAIRQATLVIAESKVGKEDILKFYGDLIKPNKIEILPYSPPNYLKSSNAKKYKLSELKNLPEKYLFYPAQFWPHKNHLRILKVLALLRDRHKLDIPLVLCGSHGGELREKTFSEIIKVARLLKIDKNLFYLGYVDDKYIKILYKNATALIMPTFFGPTNIPILEAWSLNCPVITSNLRGVRDQAGDAALLVDPKSVDSIARGIFKIWTYQKLRDDLVRKGKRRLALYTQDDYNMRLKAIIARAKKIVEKSYAR